MSKPGEQKRYARAPLTEAVLEVRSDKPLTARDLERCRDKFKRQYEKIEELSDVEFAFNEGKVSHKAVLSGYKMTAKNAVDVVLISPLSLATIRLAPYQCWEELLVSAKANFETVTKLVGRQTVVRIGARFVNRIDIPNEQLTGRQSTDFILADVHIPDKGMGAMTAYFFNAHTLRTDGIKLVIQSGIANPVLIDHTSILLDIDASFEGGIPTRIEEMWEKTELLRSAKNSVFESSITDRCRELFQ